ncbi:CrcB family protein [Demequina sp. B12]|uniref:fluoride efflux transporter FluC n=1 Tax=Demequina sp. B12 TaxID=2992757 RepID=UPI00237AD200|nr:CrcB family protein [Demequina sp. B12]MDE0572573.1 CrcB family protein [Demequina sp. B12]
MSVWWYVAAALGCGVGAVLRYQLGRVNYGANFPWGTVVANTVAAALVGALAALAALYPGWNLVLAAGLGGGLSTFSSLAVDAVILWNEGRRRHTVGYLAVTFAAGFVAAWAGWAVASALVG